MAVRCVEGFDEKLHVLIMAGGSGTRFWPKSRAKRPKQLLALWDDKTLLEHTVKRFADLVSQENIWVVTAEHLVEPSKEALGAKYERLRYLGEPVAKNTAPCILWGVKEIHKIKPEAVVAVMPADGFIGDEEALLNALSVAIHHARANGALVTIGIKPNRPETGYGYIELENRILPGKPGPVDAVAVRQFVEKPDLRTALRYVESGKYLWNAGMFIFTAKAALDAFQKTMPDLARLFDDKAFTPGDSYPQIQQHDSVSVDYGVMERATSQNIPIAVVSADCGWNDVGSFPALEEINCSIRGDVVSHDAACNVVQSDSGLVALLGVNDLVVVRDGDVVLVAAKDRAQDIKALLEKVKRGHPDKV